MPLLVKLDVAQYTDSHEEDEGRIEKDQSSLANVGVIEEDEAGREDAGREGVTRLPHDEENSRDGQSSQQRRKRSVGHIRDLVVNVRVTNVVKQELTIEANQPAYKGKEEFREGRVDVEEVDSLQVV